MPIGPGSRLGPYEVTALLGEGGMGKVWRAHHTALKRDDALKVLPDAFAADPNRLARFQREAQVLASLNHPNIAHVYGFEQAAGIQALVMELVEGPTLADRIAQGPIPLDEALSIARQIAEALETAHEHGIIHRDLKPANVKVRPDGSVKVLDFGLAKLNEPNVLNGENAPNASLSPTITSPGVMTGVGVLLGTAAYMSPEQAKGKPADKRSDIWAFGCVLYEMLTGKRALEGDDIAETLANVVKAQVDWAALPLNTPVSVLRLLRRCLAKNPRQRTGDASTVRLDLEETQSGVADPPGSVPSRRTMSSMMWPFAWVASMGLAVAAAILLRPAPQERVAPEMRLDIETPATADPLAFAISPDGRRLVYVAGERAQLWLR